MTTQTIVQPTLIDLDQPQTEKPETMNQDIIVTPDDTINPTYDLAVIAPSPSASGRTRQEIDSQLYAMFANGAKKNPHQTVKIHVIGKRSANDAMFNAANRYQNIELKTYNINQHEGKNAAYRTIGRIAPAVKSLIVLEGENTAHPSTDQALIDKIAKAKKPIRRVQIRKIHRKTWKRNPGSPPLRINLRQWKTLDDLLEAYTDTTPNDLIYCGAASKAKNAPKSPLANPYRNKPTWEKRYKTWLFKQIQENNREVMIALRKISPKTPLICWCADDKPCHTDIIRNAAAYVQARDLKKAQRIVKDAFNNTPKVDPAPKIDDRCKAHKRNGKQCTRPSNAETVYCTQHARLLC